MYPEGPRAVLAADGLFYYRHKVSQRLCEEGLPRQKCACVGHYLASFLLQWEDDAWAEREGYGETHKDVAEWLGWSQRTFLDLRALFVENVRVCAHMDDVWALWSARKMHGE